MRTEAKELPLISVIVPIFKIEPYINECIESIIDQTYRNLEIILVDDGSPDRCGEICDLYAQKDDRIKVIHQENKGLVVARKKGLEMATGIYVGYVDGDDWIEKEYYEQMVLKAIEFDADVVVSNHSRDFYDISVPVSCNHFQGLYSKDEMREICSKMISYGEFYTPGISTYVWNKLFKRKLLTKYQLEVDDRITIGEDAAVVYPFLLSCGKVYLVDNYQYHYRQRNDSMLKVGNSLEKEVYQIRILLEYLQKQLNNDREKYNIHNQLEDFMLAMYMNRSGGFIQRNQKPIFLYYEKVKNQRIAICSAGSLGQQLVKRMSLDKDYCIVKWYDDDDREYRKDGMKIDAINTLNESDFDYLVIASINPLYTKDVYQRLLDLDVPNEKIILLQVEEQTKKELIKMNLYQEEFGKEEI